MGKTKRLEWIDLLRSAAILAVVLCHAAEGVYTLSDFAFFQTLSLKSRAFSLTAFTLGRMGVPVFLMISGYLLLDREYDTKQTVHFWKKNWLRLLICTEIWFLIYAVFQMLYAHQPFSLLTVLEDLLFIRRPDLGHQWYMPMILGLYLLIPFTARALNSIDLSLVKFPMIFFSLYVFGFPILEVINHVCGGKPLAMLLSLGFSGGAYGIYLVFGYLLKKGVLKKIRSWLLAAVSIVSFVSAVLFQLWSCSRGYHYNIWYDSLFLLVSSVSVFELASRIRRVPFISLIRGVSYYSFAVYLTHFLFRNMLVRQFSKTSLILPLRVILVWSLSFLISICLSWLIGRIPYVGKKILYLKEASHVENEVKPD